MFHFRRKKLLYHGENFLEENFSWIEREHGLALIELEIVREHIMGEGSFTFHFRRVLWHFF